MSLLTRAPTMASLIADGLDQTMPLRGPAFESILRERAAVGLAVMRVLAQRLAAAEGARAGDRWTAGEDNGVAGAHGSAHVSSSVSSPRAGRGR